MSGTVKVFNSKLLTTMGKVAIFIFVTAIIIFVMCSCSALRPNNIWADYFTKNPASGRVMQKCGFEDTGKLHQCPHLVGGDKDMIRIYKLAK